jgi:hypothetical protein
MKSQQSPQSKKSQFRQLEKEIETTDATIAAYCKELGIDTPY